MKLTEKQKKYVEKRLDGESQAKSALIAGYSDHPSACTTPEKSEKVKQALALARSELSSATQIKRADVIEMLMEAYDMAKLGAEASSMVAAAREIGKMLGFYEPETVKLELTGDQAQLQTRLRTLTDEELLQIAQGQAKVIEGEFQHIS
jgi:phage terminase small subunit